jgi:DNA-binding CsgD family transcriptional regulator
MPRGPSRTTDPSGLTHRQREILSWIAQGASNAAIASALSISPSTLQHHIRAIYDRTGCTNRTQAALFFLRTNQNGVDGERAQSA